MGTSYAAEVLADAPLGYWRMGEPSGTTMVDSSGNGRNGTYAGSPVLGGTGLIVGDVDTAVEFDGTAKRAYVTAPATWMQPTVITAECWIKPDVITGSHAIMNRANFDEAFGIPWSWYVHQSAAKVLGRIFVNGASTNSGDLTSVTNLVAASTYHVVLTFNGATARLYINGALEVSVAPPGR